MLYAMQKHTLDHLTNPRASARGVAWGLVVSLLLYSFIIAIGLLLLCLL
jgi:uncharacterized protein (DUF2062 family)